MAALEFTFKITNSPILRRCIWRIPTDLQSRVEEGRNQKKGDGGTPDRIMIVVGVDSFRVTVENEEYLPKELPKPLPIFSPG